MIDLKAQNSVVAFGKDADQQITFENSTNGTLDINADFVYEKGLYLELLNTTTGKSGELYNLIIGSSFLSSAWEI